MGGGVLDAGQGWPRAAATQNLRRQKRVCYQLTWNRICCVWRAFALVSYRRVLPQITRMAAGVPPGDPRFIPAWDDTWRRIGAQLQLAPTPTETASSVTS